MSSFSHTKYLIVGCGCYGAVMAERIATNLDENVLVIDSRNHIGGNCYSECDDTTGVDRHVYGSHIFHTNTLKVWDYINKFTRFNSYIHKVFVTHAGMTYHMPINLLTINNFYRKNFSPVEAKLLLAEQIKAEGFSNPQNFEEKAISLMGRQLYNAFIKGYTAKQWETDPVKLPASIITRLPVKFNYDLGYFSDPWQGIPAEGFTRVFERLLDHPRIEVRLGVDFFHIKEQLHENCVIIYSGPIDRYFNYKYGTLGYRSLRFENEIVNTGDFQGTAVMNYADIDVPFTRIHEFKHYHPEKRYCDDITYITKEYSVASGKDQPPYYPIRTANDIETLKRYQADADQTSNLICGGRLGSYKYLDMDDAIYEALNDYETKLLPILKKN